MNAKKIYLALTLAVIAAFGTLNVRAQSNDDALAAAQGGGILDTLEQMRERQSQQFEGSWDLVITPVVPPGVPPPPALVAHASVARGGAYFGSDRTRPLGNQHGVWEHQGGNRFAITLKEDLFDAMGNFVGIATVRAQLTLTGRDEFVGVANGEQCRADGTLIFSRCSTIRGTRIKLEPLPEPCQNITPPQ
jgi:hypothetical protein